MSVGEVFLSAFLQKFDDLLEKLKITLLTVTALLNNAEEKQFHGPPVEKWLHMARDALYDAEDILDELATETLRCKLEAEYNQILLTLNNCRNSCYNGRSGLILELKGGILRFTTILS
ncbi:hypothetical protein RGQ29_016653 [Quercus rubra]|uniref:Disease resistance N-terminal domain-containing protein n=1 Tax=Quercus rubra TaxID=3512 RepID=A0AAN7ISA0_QUERU|nr:hypothetical protein RGQ29_016653 [Quercus rubra]